MNYQEIVSQVESELGRADLSSNMSDWVDRVYRYVLACDSWSWLNATASRSTVDGVYRYSLPTDFQDSTEVLLVDGTNSRVLDELLIDEFDSRHPYPLGDAKDRPSECAIHWGRGEDLVPYIELLVWPVPNNVYRLDLRYVVRAATLSGTATPIIPVQYHSVLVYGALQQAFARLREYDAALYWENQKEKLIATMIREDRMLPNVKRQLGEFKPTQAYSADAHLNPFIRRIT